MSESEDETKLDRTRLAAENEIEELLNLLEIPEVKKDFQGDDLKNAYKNLKTAWLLVHNFTRKQA